MKEILNISCVFLVYLPLNSPESTSMYLLTPLFFWQTLSNNVCLVSCLQPCWIRTLPPLFTKVNQIALVVRSEVFMPSFPHPKNKCWNSVLAVRIKFFSGMAYGQGREEYKEEGGNPNVCILSCFASM